MDLKQLLQQHAKRGEVVYFRADDGRVHTCLVYGRSDDGCEIAAPDVGRHCEPWDTHRLSVVVQSGRPIFD